MLTRLGATGWFQLVVFLIIFLVVCYALGKHNIYWDLTSDQRYSLTEGSKQVLRELSRPVSIRFYLSEEGNQLPVVLRNYSERVENLLRSVKQYGGDNIQLVQIDPQPDTSGMESASIDGIEARSISVESEFYMGLAFSSSGGRTSIPFLDPGRDQLLEYEIINNIANVSQTSKKAVGLISSLPIMQPGRTWNVIQKISESYELVPINSKEAVPAHIDSVIVVFPYKVSSSFDNVIDSFTARGGNLIVLLDSLSHSADIFQISKTSSGVTSAWPGLEQATGITFSNDNTVVDNVFGTELDRGEGIERLNYVLSIHSEGINPEHEITQALNKLTLVSSGSIQTSNYPELNFTPLVRSTELSALRPSEQILSSGKYENTVLNNQFQADPHVHIMAALVSGRLRSFTDGKLRSKAKTSTTIVIADTDFIADPYTGWIENIQGKRVFIPANHNVALLLNSLSHLHGNASLNQARSKASQSRPLFKLSELQMHIQNRHEHKIMSLSLELDSLIKSRDNYAFKNSESSANNIYDKTFRKTIEKKDMEIRRVSTELRLENKLLQEQITSITTRIKMLNIITLPALLAIAGMIFLSFRRHRCRTT
ncbi:Gldg family protein [Agaribacterium haliotis]|uniref:Gldg family protein n=1 Tax=Agaribacterium haliotis TaxID=2013869 RepID=UPI001304648F|nr:Gldg family protein [Agaribacterium haliotis]